MGINTTAFLPRYLLQRSLNPHSFIKRYRYVILALTYIAYTMYHLSRKSISVVKSTLRPPCSNYTNNNTCPAGWPPFDGPNGNGYLGVLDSAFLFSYAAGMFLSGHIAERVDLRWFLVFGMVLSGGTTALFGLGKYLGIHHVAYYAIVQALCGLVQSTGWPAVVTCLSNWFGKGRRGLIMGVWNSHTSVGNILGALVAGWFVQSDWGLSFLVPACVMLFVSLFVLLLLVPSPFHLKDSLIIQESSNLLIGDDDDDDAGVAINADVSRVAADVTCNDGDDDDDAPGARLNEKAISFYNALAIPGVVEFSLCLFFSKLVSYTFLFWLPFYISNSTTYDTSASAELSTLFDVGGILGGVVAGAVSDMAMSRALTCSIMFLLAAPAMYLYYFFAHISLSVNIGLLMVTGFMVNGPYALITTAVSADLGTHPSLAGNCKALSTVTCIIDGTGSVGAALGPLLTALITPYGWRYVFHMLVVADVLALLLLGRLSLRDVCRCLRGDERNL